jgi:uncharacterized protein (DUF2235 family)
MSPDIVCKLLPTIRENRYGNERRCDLWDNDFNPIKKRDTLNQIVESASAPHNRGGDLSLVPTVLGGNAYKSPNHRNRS